MIAVHMTKLIVGGAVIAYVAHQIAQVVTDVAWLLQ